MNLSQQSLKEIIQAYREALAEPLDLPMWVRLTLAFFEHHPEPAWIKAVMPGDAQTQMIQVNRAYQEQVGVSLEEYQGNADNSVWDNFTTDSFALHDQEAIDKRSPVRTVEYSTNPITKVRQRWIGWKWPVILDGYVVAVCGCAVLDAGYDGSE